MKPDLQTALYLAGIAQLALVAGSLLIPGILKWKVELNKVNTLIKQMFWTYAAYILVINLCFGLISVFAFNDLTNGSFLGASICGFIAIYWISRVLVQFFYFDSSSFPKGGWNKIAEVLLVTLFVVLSLVYSVAFYNNYQQL